MRCDLLIFPRPLLPQQWARMALHHASRSSDPIQIVRSVAIFAAIAEKITSEDVVIISTLILSSEEGEAADKLRELLTELLKFRWSCLDIASMKATSRMAVTLLQAERVELFHLGLEILFALFAEEGREQILEAVIPAIRDAWVVPPGSSLDWTVVQALVRGLTIAKTSQKALWLLQTLYYQLAVDETAIYGQMALVILLYNHVLVLNNPSTALNVHKLLKGIDRRKEVPTIVGTFKTFGRNQRQEEHLEDFYREISSVYPEEDSFRVIIRVLEDLTHCDDPQESLSAVLALGNFLQYVSFCPLVSG